jgi:phage shock protein C
MKKKKLYRSRTDRMLAGICGGIAQYLGFDSSMVRLAFLLLLLVTGVFPFAILYVIGIYVIPMAPEGYDKHNVVPDQ